MAGAADLPAAAGPSAAEDDWLLVPVFHSEAAARRAAGRIPCTVSQLRDLGAQLLWVVHPDDRDAFLASAEALTEEAGRATAALTVLVPRRPAPDRDFRTDGPVVSFGCSLDVCAALRLSLLPCNLSAACYRVVGNAVRGTSPAGQLLVRQIPTGKKPPALPHSAPVEALIAHRGDAGLLATALHYLRGQVCAPASVRVGLDGERATDYRELQRSHPGVHVYRVTPAPAGLYVIREQLAGIAAQPFLMWQDSDDVPTADRTGCLLRELRRTSCDYIGSHELRIDEFRRRIDAIRFPLDVNAALDVMPGHSLYDASALIRRTAFRKVGGYSTNRTFANDTQFVLRAAFRLAMRNVDRFLYVRRKRRGSLTTSRRTGARSAPRLSLDRQWKQDFVGVQAGRLSLAESSLAVEKTPVAHRLRAL